MRSAGTLSGYAAGVTVGKPVRDVLGDVLAVMGERPGMQWEALAVKLAERFPDRWEGVTAESVSAECRALGVPVRQIKTFGQNLNGCRKADIERIREEPGDASTAYRAGQPVGQVERKRFLQVREGRAGLPGRGQEDRMTEVRKHQRQTASGKRTTVRHHTRGGEKARREDEAEAAREAGLTVPRRTCPRSGTAEPERQSEEWWAEDDRPPPSEFWDEDDTGEDGGHLHPDWAKVEHEGHTFRVNRAPAYQPQGDHDFAGDAPGPKPPAHRAEQKPRPEFTGEVRKPKQTRKQKRAAIKRYKAAKAALARYHCRTETPKYLRLNREVIEASKDIPWWRRG